MKRRGGGKSACYSGNAKSDQNTSRGVERGVGGGETQSEGQDAALWP